MKAPRSPMPFPSHGGSYTWDGETLTPEQPIPEAPAEPAVTPEPDAPARSRRSRHHRNQE